MLRHNVHPHKNMAIYNETANVMTRTLTETEIGYAPSPTAISYITLLFVRLAQSTSGGSRTLVTSITPAPPITPLHRRLYLLDLWFLMKKSFSLSLKVFSLT